MGLLDSFFNPNDPQSMGLLSAASQILQQSGNTHQPYGLGQAMGTGIQGYMQGNMAARQMQQQAAEEEQQRQMRALQIKGLQSDQQLKQQMTDRNDRIRNRLMGSDTPQMAPQSQAQPQSSGYASAAPGGPMSPKVGGPDWMQQFQADTAGAAPTQQRPAAAPQPGAIAGGNQMLIDRLSREAQVRTEEGDVDGANKALEHVAKLMPEVNKIEVAMNNGVPVNVITFKDGRQQVSQFGVAEKLHFGDNGQNLVGIDQYTGQVKSSLKKQQSLESIAGNAVTMRGQNMVDARTREQNGIANDANSIKRQDAREAKDATKAGQVASFDTMLGTLGRLADHPGLSRSVGVMSKVPTIPGSESANFQAELETFKSQAFIPMVSQLKGMGALSDAEGRKLTASVGALDPSMGEKAFRESVSRIMGDMGAARARVSGTQQAGGASADGNSGKKPAPKSVMRGQTMDGYRFKGGDPSNPSNWEKL